MPHTAPISTTRPENASDPDLAGRAAQGDTQAFECIMRRHNQLLFRTARSILRNDDDAEDALQDAYLRAWQAMGSFRDDARLSTWLARIVINESLGRLRRRGAQVIPLGSSGEADGESAEPSIADDLEGRPERLAMRQEIRHLMERRIDKLPDLYRTVFMLRAVEEMSVDEVAAMLSMPAATVRTRYFRGRSLLRESLSREIDVGVGDAFSFDGSRCNRIVTRVLARLDGGTPARNP
ncbi:RNA polymerase sigma factor [Variovorax saccharolyticus]|uniref:RNA polymerase sigma factor n=1 Tax=Variovorax saccharolyticus TaxID=3053516 RepID=UPI002576D669|nr:RNA polymerase sigma factor [Variovorax sp. J31P216]MDM0023547.1 RNA polymerase sigma factor [Variovorax sp. J31P216]